MRHKLPNRFSQRARIGHFLGNPKRHPVIFVERVHIDDTAVRLFSAGNEKPLAVFIGDKKNQRLAATVIKSNSIFANLEITRSRSARLEEGRRKRRQRRREPSAAWEADDFLDVHLSRQFFVHEPRKARAGTGRKKILQKLLWRGTGRWNGA